jgi:hypothetical protein
VCGQLQIAAGLGSHEQLLGRPLLPGLWITCHFGRGEGVELEIVRRVHRDQLALKMSGELGQLQTEPIQHAEDLVAIGLALGCLFEVEETLIPGRDLYAFEAESRGPPGYIFQFVEGLLVSGKLGQENCRAFHSLHRDTHPFQICTDKPTHPARLLLTARSTKAMLRTPSRMPGTSSLSCAAGSLKRARTAVAKSR